MSTPDPTVTVIIPEPISVQPPDLVQVTMSKELAATLVGIMSHAYVATAMQRGLNETDTPTSQVSKLRVEINNRLWGATNRDPIAGSYNELINMIKERRIT